MPLNPDFVPQPHQEKILNQAIGASDNEAPYRKLLLWQPGAGKSYGSLAAADALGKPYTAIVPAALRKNYNQEMNRFLINGPSSSVLSYNQIAAGKTPPPDVQTLVFDEASRVTSPGSMQGAAARRLAASVPNLLLLSGTPTRNRPQELAPLIEMLTGKRMTEEDFAEKFIKKKPAFNVGILGRLRGIKAPLEPQLHNAKELKKLLEGKIDYYDPEASPVDVKHEDVVSELTKDQAHLYNGFWEKLPWVIKWKLRFNYPLTDEEFKRSRAFLTGPRQVGLSVLPFMTRPDPLKAFDRSGKLTKAFDRLSDHLDSDPRKKAIVYSNFVHAGLKPYSAALTRAGIPHALFDGTLTDTGRKDLIDAFNTGKIKVALVGPAGSEGISLKGAQLTQILDPHFHQARTDQASARGVRFDSHTNLPKELQSMKIERYISHLPKGLSTRLLARLGMDDPSKRMTTDDYLRQMSDRKQKLIDQFIDVMKEVSANQKRAADEFLAAYNSFVKYSSDTSFVPGAISQLVKAKQLSDVGRYQDKTNIVRTLIQKNPEHWVIDSHLNPKIVGLTHSSGFRIHLPYTAVKEFNLKDLAKAEANTYYHGSPNSDLTELNPDSFVTPDLATAELMGRYHTSTGKTWSDEDLAEPHYLGKPAKFKEGREPDGG